ncbi:prolipoprotein diacylglyceryl transferase [Amycolatopsis balhimycina DSM 5908]|uniref:Phosphatidylglycerol--prolipoprotein diacylglyceryl transferase n=1 Tax=Amycolatopsis balhimycina DSM 5908 TaxID=1081091 RepID=A0A428WXT6_AMYBA|nr:prolipoprotein diacylglyceryl transferase [Amycolatopsis balhimycina]RSM47903.1 prolipoprotein diacylglyceryl transferase [Amycolatopsis balhimycina DSM 5908]
MISAYLATIPSPDRGVWHLGPIPIRAYALCIIAGIIVAIWWGERRWAARGGTKGTVIDMAVFAVPFGLVGGRLYHVITDPELYFTEGRNPWNAFAIWDGGLGIWGAIALGAVGALIACRRRGIPLPAMADAVAPGIVVAQAIGRIGNYFNQELYGAHTDLPWGLEVYQRFNPEDPDNLLNGVATGHIPLPESPVHPTFLYELLWNLLVALLVVWADRRFTLGHGRAFALYVAGYTVGRGWIEMMRTDTANHILGLRVNVWTSILLFLAAVVYFVAAGRRGPREAPETLVSKDAVGPDEVPVAAEEPEASEAGSAVADEPEPVAADEPEHAKVAADAPASAEKPAADAPAEEPKKTDES